MSETRHFRIGEVDVAVGPASVVSRWPDGLEVHAQACHTAEDVARSRSLGYDGDVERMTREHDVLHHLIATARGERGSPTLRGVAEGRAVPAVVSADEEAIVLLVQRLLNVGLQAVLSDG